jgi:aconitate hydratase
LGIHAVLAESYERIHRSNLVGMGILPLQFLPGQNAASLGLTGFETFDIPGIAAGLKPGQRLTVQATDDAGKTKSVEAICRIDTPYEMQYYQHGGILQFVLRQLLA